ncbi:unnamed protein product [Arctogadus glacialis]
MATVSLGPCVPTPALCWPGPQPRDNGQTPGPSVLCAQLYPPHMAKVPPPNPSSHGESGGRDHGITGTPAPKLGPVGPRGPEGEAPHFLPSGSDRAKFQCGGHFGDLQSHFSF